MIFRLLVLSIFSFLSSAVVAGVDDGTSSADSLDLIMADNPRKERRDDRQEGRGDRRDDRRDCRGDEGLVGKDKRDCKQENRGDDDKGNDGKDADDKDDGHEDDKNS